MRVDLQPHVAVGILLPHRSDTRERTCVVCILRHWASGSQVCFPWCWSFVMSHKITREEESKQIRGPTKPRGPPRFPTLWLRSLLLLPAWLCPVTRNPMTWHGERPHSLASRGREPMFSPTGLELLRGVLSLWLSPSVTQQPLLWCKPEGLTFPVLW